jgi:glycosyltransferase involved in cell wall biosynthesis
VNDEGVAHDGEMSVVPSRDRGKSLEHRAQSVLFVTTSFPRFSGDYAGTCVFNLAKYLTRDGMVVSVVCPGAPGYPEYEEMHGIAVHRFQYFLPANKQCLAYGDGREIMGNLRSFWLARFQLPIFLGSMFLSVLRRQREFDLVHCHWLPTAVVAKAARFIGRSPKPIVFSNWGDDTRGFPKKLLGRMLKHINGLMPTSVEMEAHLKAAGCKGHRRIEIPIDEERFQSQTVSNDLRQELGVSESIPILAFVARLTEIKDPLNFIGACDHLRRDGLKFLAVVAGDGDLMTHCRCEIDARGLDHHVRLLGMRSDAERLLKIACLSAHTSAFDNVWSTTIGEAMCMDVPVVLTDAGYTRQIFTNEQDCLLVPPRNHRALADAMRRIVNEPFLGIRLAAGARQLLKRMRKDATSIVQDTREYYDQVVARVAD